MLRLADLMNNPDDVQPIGTRKGVMNKPTHVQSNPAELFTAASNTNMLRVGLYSVYRQNGGKSSSEKFDKLVVLLQRKFMKENNLNDYITAEADATGMNNYMEALRAINQDFTRMTYTYFKWDMYNPFHDDIEVGPSEHRVLKKSAEIMPEDHGTLDVWREQFTQSLNRQFRDKNRIPVYRTSLQTRHFDRGNEGLQSGDPERASLETPIYGYDMKRVSDTVLNYKSADWYGL